MKRPRQRGRYVRPTRLASPNDSPRPSQALCANRTAMHATLSPPPPAIEDQVTTVLRKSPFLRKTNLRFETHEGRVILRGSVKSYFQKQMAQEAVRGVAGVKTVENRLEVDWT